MPRPPAINVLALSVNGHRHVYLFDDASRREVARQIGRDAADPEHPLTWRDAAELIERTRPNE